MTQPAIADINPTTVPLSGDIEPTTAKLSANNIGVDGRWEYIQVGTQIYIAPLSNAIDVATGNRPGRWECSAAHALRYPLVYGWLAVSSGAKYEVQ